MIKACRDNDRQAQEDMYRYFFPKLLPMIKRYANNNDDIVSIFNDGMLRVFTQIDTYTASGNFEGWVRRVVSNSLSNYYRKNGVKVKISEIQDYTHNTSSDILSDMYYEDLIKLLDLVPEKSSTIFKMYVLDGFSHKEIAEELGISVGTSKWHVFKAREQLTSSIELNRESYER